ncbi:MAG: NnrS family protein, partial [Steroidobacteraceae bacterium]
AWPAALWTFAFRPFFLAASLWSVIAIVVWIVMLATGAELPSRFDPLSWHIHEMLFGFVPAAIAGFMLTAIPSWTGRKPIRGRALAALALLWLLGRAACLCSARMPLALAAAVDLAFPFALCAVAAREIIAARNWRNLPMPIPIAVLGVADALMYLPLAGVSVAPQLGWRLGLAAIIILISAVGGRIVPSFTRNWLVARGAARRPAVHDLVDRVGLAVLHAGLIGWALLPVSHALGAVLIAAAALTLYRLARWRGMATLSEPLLAVLHVGYGWVMVGVALLGASMLGAAVPLAAAVHALTAGAIGTMVLAVMTRVSLGHTGRALRADRVTGPIYGLVCLAAAVRIVAGVAGKDFLPLIELSAALWVASFALFAIHYGRMLVAPRVQ